MTDFITSLHERFNQEDSIILNEKLLKDGYYIIENSLPINILKKLADEIFLLEDSLDKSPNRLSISDDEFEIFTKHHVFEKTIVQRDKMLIQNKGLLSLVPMLESININKIKLVNAFKNSCHALNSITNLDQLKVAIIKKGGSFPIHTDTQVDTGRTLSVTLYLNEEYDNLIDEEGELVIYPFPPKDDHLTPIEIKPYFGRMVLFSSCNLFHRVKRCNLKNRMCLSLMFYGNNENDYEIDEITNIKYSTTFPYSPIDFPNYLFKFRNILTPLIYFEEFHNSMLEAFTDCNEEKYDSDDENITTREQLLTRNIQRQLYFAINHFIIKSKKLLLDKNIELALENFSKIYLNFKKSKLLDNNL